MGTSSSLACVLHASMLVIFDQNFLIYTQNQEEIATLLREMKVQCITNCLQSLVT